MQSYVIEKEQNTVISNYYQYYKAFTQSGIISLYEGSVSWIIPCEGEKGPSIAFRVRLNEENAEIQLKTFIQGIREGKVPQIWHITPDASPDNIIDIMKKNGFKSRPVWIYTRQAVFRQTESRPKGGILSLFSGFALAAHH